jgi:hypothetical protein
MLSKKSLASPLSLLSVFTICAVLLGSVFTAPSKAMDGEEVHEELEKNRLLHKNSKIMVEALQENPELSRCIKKVTGCCKYRSCARIEHNVYTKITRCFQCIWNFLWCRGCKHNRRLEKDLRDR